MLNGEMQRSQPSPALVPRLLVARKLSVRWLVFERNHHYGALYKIADEKNDAWCYRMGRRQVKSIR